LASYAIQAELGDYDENVHTVEYFREFYLFPENLVSDPDGEKQAEKLDTLIQMTINKYVKLTGLDTSESEQHFVQICQENFDQKNICRNNFFPKTRNRKLQIENSKSKTQNLKLEIENSKFKTLNLKL